MDQWISSIVGDYGIWQFLVTYFALISRMCVSMNLINIVAIAPAIEFKCVDNADDQCADNCTQYEYDKSVFTNTIQMQWDLVCNFEVLTQLAQTVAMAGVLFGNPIFGYLADKFGRRLIFLISNVLLIVANLAQAFVPWYPVFLVFRFFASAAIGSMMVNGFVILMEVIGSKYRMTVAMIFHLFFVFGYMLVPVFSYFLRDWRFVIFTIAVFPCLSLPAFCFLPESPRWLITKGKIEETVKLLSKAAQMNKRSTETVKETVESSVEDKSGDGPKEQIPLFKLLRSKTFFMRTLSMGVNWFMCGFCFYGMTQYTSGMSGDFFLNVAVTSTLPTPGVFLVWVLLVKVGRKYALMISNILGTVSMFCMTFLESGSIWLLATASLGICGFYMSFCVVYMYSGEVYPTVIRNIVIGIMSMIARIGSIIAPFVMTLQVYTADWVPPLIFGIVGAISTVMCIFLPETLNKPLPDTIEDAMEIK